MLMRTLNVMSVLQNWRHWWILTCCAAKRQQSRAPHRKLLTKDYGGLIGPYGYKKNWVWRAASPTWWARAGLQSWKIGTFWWAVDIFALFLSARNLVPQLWHCLESWNQLRNLRIKKRFNRGSHFCWPGIKFERKLKIQLQNFWPGQQKWLPRLNRFLIRRFLNWFQLFRQCQSWGTRLRANKNRAKMSTTH